MRVNRNDFRTMEPETKKTVECTPKRSSKRTYKQANTNQNEH